MPNYPLRKGLMNLSDRIKRLPRDYRGFPIPWFVYRDVNGFPDFRVIAPGKVQLAIRRDLCWVCGSKLSSRKCFVVGPMCAINRVSAEPPMHRACAIFSATNCPFLTEPRMRRNTKDIHPEGFTLEGAQPHNPGAVLMWMTDSYTLMPVDNGVLCHMGAPEQVRWFCGGKLATRREVLRAIEKGLPILLDAAQREGDDAVRELLQQVLAARALIPTGTEEADDAVEADQDGDDCNAPTAADAAAKPEPGGEAHREQPAHLPGGNGAHEDEPSRY
jgi:hypothetical protein